VEESDTIFDLLAREQLARLPADLTVPPTAVSLYAGPQDVSAVYRALRIMHQEDGFPDDFPIPRILVAPALVLVLHDGRLIPVKEEARRELVAIPTNQPSDLSSHISTLMSQGSALYETVRRILGALPPLAASGAAFPGFSAHSTAVLGGASPAALPRLFVKCGREHAGSFIVAVGEGWHFLRPQPEGAACSYHDGRDCERGSVAAQPIILHPRMDGPSSFFVSADAHHCGHLIVAGLKQRVACKISVFEERLCCRACSFENICWSESAPQRPCP
jgi:hypothetical protein